MPRTTLIRIKSDGLAIEVDPPTFHVSKGHKDGVEWTCDSGGFTVDFGNDSPFSQPAFSSPARGSVSSGPARGDVPPSGDHHPYKYTVTAFGQQLDPDGEVDP